MLWLVLYNEETLRVTFEATIEVIINLFLLVL
jgi:hypothetical protein